MEILVWIHMYVRIGIIGLKLLKEMDIKEDDRVYYAQRLLLNILKLKFLIILKIK